MAQQTQLKPNALPGRLYGSFAGKVEVVGIVYVTVKVIRLLEDGLDRVFEVDMLQTTGTAHARLWDKTGAAVVTSSELSTTSGTIVRLRTGTLTLIDGREYQAQFGTTAADAGEGYFAALVKS